jgi:hypothetical protein
MSYPFRELAPATNMPDIGREDRRMTRREFVSLAGGTAVAWPLMAQAQQQTVPIPRIAYLGASSPAILDPRQIVAYLLGGPKFQVLCFSAISLVARGFR